MKMLYPNGESSTRDLSRQGKAWLPVAGQVSGVVKNDRQWF